MKNIKAIRQKGDKLVIEDGTKITPSDETQASHIADVTGVTTSGASTTAATAINAIIAALEDVGILASS